MEQRASRPDSSEPNDALPAGQGQGPPNDAPALPATGPYSTSVDSPRKPGQPTEGGDDSARRFPRPASGSMGLYELQEVMEEGGQGIVYKARHTTLGHTVALKTVRVRVLPGSDTARRFVREVQAVTRLTHPHIVRVYEYGEQHGQPYYTMAFLPRGSLAQHRDEYRDPRAAAALVEKVARAVQYAHEQHIWHRDLKPGNVLLDERGEPLVADFGLAKLLDADTQLTRTNMELGTLPYMAPEQTAHRTSEIGPQTDVWALGVILYEVLTGRRPFSDEGGSGALQQRIIREDPPRPRAIKAGLPRALEAIILKCLEKEPRHRYASAGLLADDLQRYLRDEPIAPQAWRHARRLWRRAAQHPARLVLAVSLLAAMVIIPTVMHFRDPERSWRVYEQQLAHGQKAVLIGESGSPKWWPCNVAQAIQQARPDGAFCVHSWEHCLIELLGDPRTEHFRLNAQIKLLEQDSGGWAGLYCGLGAHQGSYSYCMLEFGNAAAGTTGAGDPQGSAIPISFGIQILRRTDTWAASTVYLSQYRDRLRREQGDVWHDLSIEVGPKQTKALWNGRLIGSIATDRVLQQRRKGLSNFPELTSRDEAFSFRSPLGLVLYRCIAAFRRVVVEPLTDD
jgi:serine/threonine protein kinase